MHKLILGSVAGIALTACQVAPPPVLSPAEQAMAATTPAAIKKLGGRRLTGPEIRAELMDRSVQAGDRRWLISSDGSFVIHANDDTWSWGGTWFQLGDRFCTRGDRCLTVHEFAGVYRVSTDGKTLAGWSFDPS